MVEITLLIVPEDSETLVSGKEMKEQALKTGLQMISEEELVLLQAQSASVCIVPYLSSNGQTRFVLLETLAGRINLRSVEIGSDAGWSPKYPWLFKH
ncbi:MAG: hypothetical protein KBC62_01825 [Candidatus Pacebacteria bacterium]|nr:hypothetical protein [Candidatus Paceibacterota bacterium]MBP9842720.1 hypothetical protein [Candidatus Paceibacterota bacterium]